MYKTGELSRLPEKPPEAGRPKKLEQDVYSMKKSVSSSKVNTCKLIVIKACISVIRERKSGVRRSRPILSPGSCLLAPKTTILYAI